MKIFLTDQRERFPLFLDELKKTPVAPYDRKDLNEAVSTIKLERSAPDANVLFEYNIFPPKILTHLTQWHHEKREMRTGDTIVQQAKIPPFASFSQKIIFGVRICEIIREKTRQGFSYETLAGHVEHGISTFTIEDSPERQMIFKIHTFSRPGSFLTRLLGPIFSVPYQRYCTRQALQNVKRQIEGAQS